MEETDPLFQTAADFVETHVSELEDDERLQLYGLYKQASCGPCATAKPSFIDFKGRAKWSVLPTICADRSTWPSQTESFDPCVCSGLRGTAKEF